MIPSHIAGYPIILPEHRHRFHTEHPEWHKAWLDSIHESLKPDDVIVDVGSEQGDLSALVASWVPDGGVVLIEPQPLFWPTIRETFEANGLEPRRTFQAIAADSSDYRWVGEGDAIWPDAAFELGVDDPGFFHLNEHGANVPTMTLEYMIHASVILIDVEGSEIHVLRGAEGLLARTKPLVWCAIHPEIMRDRYGHDPNELLVFMHRMGYRWELLAFAGEIHMKFSPR